MEFPELKKNSRLHSREHILADDLSRMLLEPKRFRSYLGIAKMYPEGELRALAKRILAKRDLEPNSRGRYFFGALRGLPKRRDWLVAKRKKQRRKTRTRGSEKSI